MLSVIAAIAGFVGAWPALEASLILLIEPVLNPVWAWVFQGERPGAWALFGGGIILAATTVKAAFDARAAAPGSLAALPVDPVD